MEWLLGLAAIFISWYGIFETESILFTDKTSSIEIEPTIFTIREYKGNIYLFSDKQTEELKK